MKIFAIASALMISAASFAAPKADVNTFKLDPAATTVKWEGKKVTGAHNGNISIKEGFITLKKDLISGGEIIVDMNTITVADIPATDEYNAKLVGHLKSPDFFNVEKYPTSKLVIKSAQKTKEGQKVKGELTFNGKTNPVEFVVVTTQDGNKLTGKSDVTLDRTKWDLKYGSNNFFKNLGDKAINNEFTLSINLNASK